METKRIEAFSDGFFSIIITIMVLELSLPQGNTFADLKQVLPMLYIYAFSFIVIAILWNNHHHMLYLAKCGGSKIMWKNHILLFMISLIPFATKWVGENNFSGNTVSFYGIVMIGVSTTFAILQLEVFKQDKKRILKFEIFKAMYSTILFLTGVIVSFNHQSIGMFLYIIGIGPWIVPSKIIEWIIRGEDKEEEMYKKYVEHEKERLKERRHKN